MFEAPFVKRDVIQPRGAPPTFCIRNMPGAAVDRMKLRTRMSGGKDETRGAPAAAELAIGKTACEVRRLETVDGRRQGERARRLRLVEAIHVFDIGDVSAAPPLHLHLAPNRHKERIPCAVISLADKITQ